MTEPSSIFSSDRVPRGPWAHTLWLAALLVGVVVFAVDAVVVRAFYLPDAVASERGWALERRRVRRMRPPERTLVIVGDSRAQADLDLTILGRELATEPVQLSMFARSVLPPLLSLQHDPKFRGRLIVGITSAFLFDASGLHEHPSWAAVNFAHTWHPTPADRVEHVLASRLNATFAAQRIDLFRLRYIAQGVPVPALLGTHRFLSDRQAVFEYYRPGVTEHERWVGAGIYGQITRLQAPEQRAQTIEAVRLAVATMRERGVRVALVRLPSALHIRDLERVRFPRHETWEPLVRACGTTAIHFEDYPELQGFDSPDGSHLTREAATEFTRRLVAILKRGPEWQ